MKSAAAIVLGFAAAACSHDLDVVVQEEQQSLDNAQATLGFYIPEDQDWKMSSEASVNVTIPGDANETYTVMFFSNNPMEDGIGYYLTKQNLRGGQNYTTEFSYPTHLKSLIVGITDSNDVTTYKSTHVENGKITTLTDIGNSAGVRTRAVSDYRDYKGSTTPQEIYSENGALKAKPYNFPSDCDASNFLAELPVINGQPVRKYSEVAGQNQTGYASGVSYLDNSWTQEVNIWGNYDQTTQKTSGGTLYIVGDNDFSNRKFLVAINTDVYLLEGATLTLNDEAASTVKFNLYIAPTAKVVAKGPKGLLKCDNGAKVYNHGTIDCNSFEVNNNSMLYNVGTLKTTGSVYAANNGSVIVNDGTIISGTPNQPNGLLNTAGSSRVQNNAEWTIYGSTIIDSNFNIWVNNGHYTTTNFCYTAGSNSVINNCYLEVTEDFNMNVSGGAGSFGAFTNAPGAGVLTKNFNGGGNFSLSYVDLNGTTQTKSHNGGPFDIRLGSKSVFKVTQTATMTGNNPNNGFFGIGEDYAVLEANEIVAGQDNQGLVTYDGNLYVSTGSHFEQGYKGQYALIVCQNGFELDKNLYAPGFASGKPNIKINPTPCNPGFNGKNPPKPLVWSYAFEDNKYSCDFDLNDVVLRVSYNVEDNSKVDIRLMAAGCEYDNYVFLNGKLVEWTRDNHTYAEVHDVFGVAKGTMVNTNRGSKATPVTTTINLSDYYTNISDFNPAEAAITIMPYKKGGDFGKVEDQKGSIGIAQLEGRGKAPVGIIVPGYWEWPTERTIITEAYSQFVKWATNVVHIEATDWYDHPTSGKVVNNIQ